LSPTFAVTIVVPTDFPVITPFSSIVAILLSLTVQVAVLSSVVD